MPSLGHFGRDLAYGDQPLADGTMALIDRTPPRTSWTFSGADGSVLGFSSMHSRLQGPQKGQRLAHWMMIFPSKGQRLPYRGLTSPFSAHFWHFRHVNVTNN
jgi:hypothetical protein